MLVRLFCLSVLLLSAGCTTLPVSTDQPVIPTRATGEALPAVTPTMPAAIADPATPTGTVPPVASAAATLTIVATGTRVLTATAKTAAPATPGVVSAAKLAPVELKYRLIEQYGIFYCPPGNNPASSEDETDRAIARFPEIQRDAEVFTAILRHHQLSAVTAFSAQQKLLAYRDYQQLGAVQLQGAGDLYTFSLRTTEELAGVVLTGTITPQGLSMVTSKQPVVNRCTG